MSPQNGLTGLLHQLSQAPPKKRVLIFGHTNIDHIFTVKFLPLKNQTTEVFEHRTFFGGTGANIALHTAALGAATSLSSYVGGNFPPDFLGRLRETGIDLGYFYTKKEHSTPSCWIYNDSDQNQMLFMDQGAMGNLDKYPVPDISFKDFDIVHIGTGRPGYYIKLLENQEECRRMECQIPADELLEKNPLITFDPGQELHYVYDKASFTRMMRNVDVFFGNKAEWDVAQELLGLSNPLDMNDVVPLGIRTCGRKGAELYTNGTITVIPATNVQEAEDTTGAGDAFRGGLYAALARGSSFRDAALMGSLTASFSLLKGGGQENLPSFGKLKKFVKE